MIVKVLDEVCSKIRVSYKSILLFIQPLCDCAGCLLAHLVTDRAHQCPKILNGIDITLYSMIPSPVRSKREKAALISAYITVLISYVICYKDYTILTSDSYKFKYNHKNSCGVSIWKADDIEGLTPKI